MRFYHSIRTVLSDLFQNNLGLRIILFIPRKPILPHELIPRLLSSHDNMTTILANVHADNPVQSTGNVFGDLIDNLMDMAVGTSAKKVKV